MTREGIASCQRVWGSVALRRNPPVGLYPNSRGHLAPGPILLTSSRLLGVHRGHPGCELVAHMTPSSALRKQHHDLSNALSRLAPARRCGQEATRGQIGVARAYCSGVRLLVSKRWTLAMFCTQCGGGLADDARFCVSCGAPVGPRVPPASGASAPPPFVAPAPAAGGAGQGATGQTFVLNQKLISMTGDLWIDNSNGNHAFEVDGKLLALRRSLLLKDTSGRESTRSTSRSRTSIRPSRSNRATGSSRRSRKP